MPAKKRRRKPVKETTLPESSDLLGVIAGMEKRLQRLERDGRRAIGFHTDCVATTEVPDPIDDENEAI